MRNYVLVTFFFLLFTIAACQRQTTVCSEGSLTYFSSQSSPSSASSLDSGQNEAPKLVEIKGKMTEVDRIIHGPICQDTWRGIIYVACDIQIMEWLETPNFFESCPLIIEPNTKIYVAAHNDTAYYKGCSCHSGELVSE